LGPQLRRVRDVKPDHADQHLRGRRLGATPPELFRNWASGRDRDSRNIETGQARMGGSPFEYPERYLSQSAFFHLDQVQRGC
jgi:hypothetical protein